ncbi:MAG: TonB family protein [Balneolales bacterium]|nr:TonB family protein [Balneolales bacterium]
MEFIEQMGIASWTTFWIPIMIWSFFAVLAALFLRALKLHPTANYYSRVAVLFSLPIGIIALNLMPVPAVITHENLIYPLVVTIYEVSSLPELVVGAENQQTEMSQSYSGMFWLGLVNILGLMVTLSLLLRHVYHHTSLVLLRRNGLQAACDDVQQLASEVADQMQVSHRNITICTSGNATIPYTFGWKKPVIVLPNQNFSTEKLKSLLAHEIMHVKRGDFQIEWLVQVVCAFTWFHPLVPVYVRDIHRFREMSCDAEVISGMIVDPRTYASLLLDFVSGGRQPSLSVMISMATPTSKLKERVTAMQFYTKSPEIHNKTRSRSLMFSVSVLVILTSLLTISGIDVLKPSDSQVSLNDNFDGGFITAASDSVFMVVEKMPEPIGGMMAIYEHVRYPDSARRDGIQGRVVIQFVVNEEGNVEDPQVIRSVREDVDSAALQAIKNVRFSPGLQRGQPVKVQFQLPIEFRIQNSGDQGERSAPPPPPPAPPSPSSSSTPDSHSGPETFTVVEKMPEPIGGMEAIYENIRYPEIARMAGIEGRVIVQFLVNKEGDVVDPIILRGIGGGADEAAIAAIKDVKFEPGMQRGQPVNVLFQLPIVFQLPDNPEAEARRAEFGTPVIVVRYLEDAQGAPRVSGKVLDSRNETPLARANVAIYPSSESGQPAPGVATDEHGNFTFTNDISDGVYTVRVSYVGFENIYATVNLRSNGNVARLELKLARKVHEIE